MTLECSLFDGKIRPIILVLGEGDIVRRFQHLECIASNSRMIKWIPRIWKEEFVVQSTTLFWMAGTPADIRTDNIPNNKQDHYLYTNPLGASSYRWTDGHCM
jgi:hypothetical protein